MKLKILCAGIGGRGVLLGSTIIIETAIGAGLHAIASDEYGMSQRGGSVISLIKIGDFRSPLIGREGADILLAFEESEFMRTLPFLRAGGTAVVNTEAKGLPEGIATLMAERGVTCHLVDADGIAGRNGMAQASNMALLGFFSRVGPEVFTFQAVERTIKQKVRGRFVEKNLAVFSDGFREAEARMR